MFATTKDPDSIEDFSLNWATNLGTDTITGSSWLVDGGLGIVAQSFTTTTTVVRLRGGTLGLPAAVAVNTVNLASGQVRQCSIQLTIQSN